MAGVRPEGELTLSAGVSGYPDAQGRDEQFLCDHSSDFVPLLDLVLSPCSVQTVAFTICSLCPTDQMKPASSRAMATSAMFLGLPAFVSLWYFA